VISIASPASRPGVYSRDLWRPAGPRGPPGPAGKKTVCGTCRTVHRRYYDRHPRQIRDLASGGVRIFLRFEGRRVACRRCGKVKTERLEWLAENPHFTRRFALHVGRLCRK